MILKERQLYDGTLIHNRFAYKHARKTVFPLGDILIFRGPMNVEAAGMIDSEDLLTNDYIYSDDAINICWEIPNLDPLGAVFFQRHFNGMIASVLRSQYNIPTSIDGDDIMVWSEKEENRRKASVSITLVKNNVALGHTGINIVAGSKAPSFAYSTNLTDKQADALMKGIEAMFYEFLYDAFIATTKVIT